MKTTTKDRVLGKFGTIFKVSDLRPYGPRPKLLLSAGIYKVYESEYDMGGYKKAWEPRKPVRTRNIPAAE